MTDFIFNVDLSTVYIIVRRDFLTTEDVIGHLSSPVGGAFYYSSTAANEIARAYCIREATKALNPDSQNVVHLDDNGLYVGWCGTREKCRDRFEVKVKRLKARGDWKDHSGHQKEEEEQETERPGTATSSEKRQSKGKRISGLWTKIKHHT
ncbi:hypothetical protein VPNG_06924 [Cytospora leucostoma]|uniref:Uncharacterized protein n=1 Tax=Cytospora leucostoma TaxID=1230097 RepID=A0A423WXA6_9PEZI|nr:hypothetical protein VPNG_06924 [Cytospora leucostoma]